MRETLEPGAVAKAVAERHGIGTGLLFTWRREMLAAAMSGFAPVEVVPETPCIEAPAPAKEMAPETPGTVEVAFPSGATSHRILTHLVAAAYEFRRRVHVVRHAHDIGQRQPSLQGG